MFDKYADEAIEAEIWLKGREQGRDNRNVEKALDMLADDEPVEKIVKYSRTQGRNLHFVIPAKAGIFCSRVCVYEKNEASYGVSF